MYFALDPKTGIDSHPEQDPWKWAQEVSEKMAVSEDSCLVFIAGQPEAMGVPLYRDLPNNQAFVSAKYLKVRRATVKYKNRLKSISQIAFPCVI